MENYKEKKRWNGKNSEYNCWYFGKNIYFCNRKGDNLLFRTKK